MNPSILGTTPEQEARVRQMLEIMAPSMSPDRVIFLDDGKFEAAKRQFGQKRTGSGSAAFIHLPSKSIYFPQSSLDNDHLSGWMAHELGHLVSNDIREDVAEKAKNPFLANWNALLQQNKQAAFIQKVQEKNFYNFLANARTGVLGQIPVSLI